MSEISEVVRDASRQLNVKVEQYLRLRIHPKPRWWPTWLWSFLLKRMVVIEMTAPTFKVDGGGEL